MKMRQWFFALGLMVLMSVTSALPAWAEDCSTQFAEIDKITYTNPQGAMVVNVEATPTERVYEMTRDIFPPSHDEPCGPMVRLVPDMPDLIEMAICGGKTVQGNVVFNFLQNQLRSSQARRVGPNDPGVWFKTCPAGCQKGRRLETNRVPGRTHEQEYRDLPVEMPINGQPQRFRINMKTRYDAVIDRERWTCEATPPAGDQKKVEKQGKTATGKPVPVKPVPAKKPPVKGQVTQARTATRVSVPSNMASAQDAIQRIEAHIATLNARLAEMDAKYNYYAAPKTMEEAIRGNGGQGAIDGGAPGRGLYLTWDVVSAFYTAHRKELEGSIWDIQVTKKMAPVTREKLDYLDRGMAAWLSKEKEVQVRMQHLVDTTAKMNVASAEASANWRADHNDPYLEARYQAANTQSYHLQGISEHLTTAVRGIGYETRLFSAIQATDPIPVPMTSVQAPTEDPTKCENLVTNGSFEQGPSPGSYLPLDPGSTAVQGWKVIQGQVDYIEGSWKGSQGPRSMDLDGTPGYGGIQQTLNTVAGHQYRLTFDLAGNPSAAPATKTLSVSVGGQRATFTHGSDLNWQQQSLEFAATQNQSVLTFTSLDREGGYAGPAIDNVRVVDQSCGKSQASPASPCDDPQQSSPRNISGVWENTSNIWGDLTLQQTGNFVTGHYPHDQGKLQGQYDAATRTLTATWADAPRYQPPRDGGRTVLIFSPDLKTFSGPWGYGNKIDYGTWDGTRKSSTPPDCSKPPPPQPVAEQCRWQTVFQERTDIPDSAQSLQAEVEALKRIYQEASAAESATPVEGGNL